MQKTNKAITAMMLIIALVAAVFVYRWASDKNEENQNGTNTVLQTRDVPAPATSSGEVAPEADYGTRVVYTADMDADPEPFRADCSARGGTFSECGSICPPDAEGCVAVCAYTCENIGE